MTEKANKFSKELDQLILHGDLLSMSIQHDCLGEDFGNALRKGFDTEKEFEAFVKKLPNFKQKYQAWYSEAQAVVKQVLPDRLKDFVSYYEYSRARKNITFQNYMIADYLQGLRITQGYSKEVIADEKAAIPAFEQQLNIIKAAKDTLKSSLIDMTSILQADIFDSEIDSAVVLSKAGFLRASGAICGVVIERHLNQVCKAHGITLKKKNPSISDYNDKLKEGSVIITSQWRQIQHLGDIRNMCDHAKDVEPTSDDIEDLVSGTKRVIKNIF